MRPLFFALALAASANIIHADDNANIDEKLLNLRIETRVDWEGAWLDGDVEKDNTGFAGKYLNLRLDGNLTDNLSYSWRQRFNKPHKDASFFDATDWIYLNYNLDNWSFAGGKQVVAIGGWEYDRPPIDHYVYSVFCYNVRCYGLGASIGRKLSTNDKLTFQFCQSPFFTSENRNLYGYNLMWNGSHGFFDAIYSVNMMEYLPGRFINYISLGNKFTFDKVALELDVMNRASSHQTFFLKDMSVIADLAYSPNGNWKVFGKFSYDVNKSGTDADLYVLNGTEMKMAGAGVEFTPFIHPRHTLRFHAAAFYSWGTNTNTSNLMQNKTMMATAGVTWYMNLLSLKRK